MTSHSTAPISPLRFGLVAQEVVPGTALLRDPLGYAEHNLAIPMDLLHLLEFFDGTTTARQVVQQASRAGIRCTVVEVTDLVAKLDDGCFLETPTFFQRQAEVDNAYNALTVRPMALADACYPSDPAQFHRQLDEWLEWDTEPHSSTPPPAIIIPHIDPQVGWKSYARAWNALRETDADTFVILGVPHVMSYDRFMICEQDFAVPGGVVETDRQFIQRLRERLWYQPTRNQIAHRDEHSIELQAIFLHHLFPDRPIKIVPILHGSFWEYVEAGIGNPGMDEKAQGFYDAMRAVAGELGRNVCWIASADLCHIGHKFGDRTTGRQMLRTIRKFDETVIAHTLRADASGFIAQVAGVRNRYRICGVAPIYATLQISGARAGKLLHYDYWDNAREKSAVTFASVGLW